MDGRTDGHGPNRKTDTPGGRSGILLPIRVINYIFKNVTH